MKKKKTTIADVFLDILSRSQDEGTKIMAERIKATIKAPEISELINICVINAMGYKSIIKESVVDIAIDGIIDFVHSEIDSSNLSKEERFKEKNSYKVFAKGLGSILKKRLIETKQLVLTK